MPQAQAKREKNTKARLPRVSPYLEMSLCPAPVSKLGQPFALSCRGPTSIAGAPNLATIILGHALRTGCASSVWVDSSACNAFAPRMWYCNRSSVRCLGWPVVELTKRVRCLSLHAPVPVQCRYIGNWESEDRLGAGPRRPIPDNALVHGVVGGGSRPTADGGDNGTAGSEGRRGAGGDVRHAGSERRPVRSRGEPDLSDCKYFLLGP